MATEARKSLSRLEKMTQKQHCTKVRTAVTVLALSLCCSLAFSASADISQAKRAANAPPSLEDLQSVSNGFKAVDLGIGAEIELRRRAMREAALSYGARAGLLRKTFEIRSTLELVAGDLDAAFNMVPLMLTDLQPGESPTTMRSRMIVPPVIDKAENVFKQSGALMIQGVQARYEMTTGPRFAPVAPSWRSYLIRDLGETSPAQPHAALLPKTPEEKQLWDAWLAEGWKAGVAQAESYRDHDLRRLVRDINGMVLYHDMVDSRMVTLPHVATANRAITGDANTLNINDSMLRITVLPAFQLDSSSWVPLTPKN